MITAVDTSVLLDVFAADPTFGPASREALRGAIAEGHLVACEVVWAEVAGAFPSTPLLRESMSKLGIELVPMALDAAVAAGVAWKAYRRHGGKRTRVVADFLIGAHALAHAGRLLTRDRGFYRTYFRKLKLLDPTA
jgi:predicted nucleic acid-binding protein